MNTKNIILGLSLVLSSVATINLTSCSDDDADDAKHEPDHVENYGLKTQQEENKNIADFVSPGAGVGMKDIDFTRENVDKVKSLVKTYLDNNLSGLTDSVCVVNARGLYASTFSVAIYAKAGKEDAVANKLKEMNNDQTALTSLLKSFPTLRTLSLSIRQNGQIVPLFRCHYIAKTAE